MELAKRQAATMPSPLAKRNAKVPTKRSPAPRVESAISGKAAICQGGGTGLRNDKPAGAERDDHRPAVAAERGQCGRFQDRQPGHHFRPNPIDHQARRRRARARRSGCGAPGRRAQEVAEDSHGPLARVSRPLAIERNSGLGLAKPFRLAGRVQWARLESPSAGPPREPCSALRAVRCRCAKAGGGAAKGTRHGGVFVCQVLR
jgi:hypothetical protein